MSARPSPEDDARFMVRALELARAQLGRTAPNPSVGCVLVMDNAIVGEGATGNGGRPHAEEIALRAAGNPVTSRWARVVFPTPPVPSSMTRQRRLTTEADCRSR